MCATRDARLVPRGARPATRGVLLDGCAGLGFVVRPFDAAGVAELDCAVLDPEVFAAGVAVDCATPDCPTTSNPNRRIKLPEPRLRTDNGEEERDIIPLYADLLSAGAAGEPVT